MPALKARPCPGTSLSLSVKKRWNDPQASALPASALGDGVPIVVGQWRLAATHDAREPLHLLGDLMHHPGEDADVVSLSRGPSPFAMRSAVSFVLRVSATIASTPSVLSS